MTSWYNWNCFYIFLCEAPFVSSRSVCLENLFKAKAFSINLLAAVSVPAGSTAKQPQRILFIYIELARVKVSKESREKDDGARRVLSAFHVDFICDKQPRINKHKHTPIPKAVPIPRNWILHVFLIFTKRQQPPTTIKTRRDLFALFAP